MAHTLRRWFDIYQDEFRAFLVAALVLFFVRSAGVLFGNYAETAFLKRFGIEHLPVLILVNSLCTFVVMAFFGKLMARVPAGSLLRRTLVGCGVVVGTLRFAIPLEIDLLYPVLYVLRTQFDLLLTFLFWNLANERFTTRQSKRLFPLITAGGIVGGVLGSFATPWVARFTSVDNFMWVYGVMVIAGAVFVRNPAREELPESPRPDTAGEPSASSSIIEEIRRAAPVLRESSLARYLVVMTLLPNIVIPLLNYQFSFAVDMTYHTEASMLGFYSTFRGVQYVLALAISLFAGRLYARFGIPTSLMFHPLNYVFVFTGFLFQFDIFTAVYAGISVGVLRMSVHNPARTALFGLFKERERVLLRVLLRSTVVRVGLLLGSVLVLICQGGYLAICHTALHPQNLSPFGMAFGALWLWVTLRLRRKYPTILLQSIGHEPPAAPPTTAPVLHGVRLPDEFLTQCRDRVEGCYRSLFEARDLRRISPPSPHRDLLARHLVEAAEREALEILAAAAQRDPSGQLASVRRALDSGNSRRRSNALETLDHILDRSLTQPLLPWLERLAPADRLAAGARYAQGRRPESSSPAGLFGRLLRDTDWVTQLLALDLARHDCAPSIDETDRLRLAESDNPQVRGLATAMAPGLDHGFVASVTVTATPNAVDAIVLLNGMAALAGVAVRDLAEMVCSGGFVEADAGREIALDGEPFQGTCLVLAGALSVGCDAVGCGLEAGGALLLGPGDAFSPARPGDPCRQSLSGRVVENVRLLLVPGNRPSPLSALAAARDALQPATATACSHGLAWYACAAGSP